MLGNCQHPYGGATRASALLITVNYKDESATIDLLTSLKHVEGASRVDVIVVDNGSEPKSLAKLRNVTSLCPNFNLMESNTNRGYFGAAKCAFDHYLSSGHSLPDWVIVCNHDVIIDDQQFLMKLLSRDPCAVGIIAPRIQVLADGTDQNPFMRRRPGRLRWASLRLVYSNYFFANFWDWLSRQKRKLLRLLKNLRMWSSAQCNLNREEIYAPHGSFFIFSRQFFDKGGYLDTNLFLYGEEISVAEICRTLGLRVLFDPSLSVLHHEHLSTGRGITRFSYNYQKRALAYLSDSALRQKTFLISPSGTAS